MKGKTQILKELEEYKNFRTRSEWADFLGISLQLLNQWERRGTFNETVLFDKFPEVNKVWILTGEGDMFVNNGHHIALPASASSGVAEVIEAEVVEVPYVSQRVAQDPHLDIKKLIENQEIETRNLLTLLGNFDGVQSVFRNAMEPDYHRGDLLLFQYVSITGRLQQGTYIVDIDDMGAMLGDLIDNGQTIEISFRNPNFKPFSIARNKLRSAATISRHIKDERSLSIMPKKPYDMENINKMLAQHDEFLQQQKALIAQHDTFLAQQNRLIEENSRLVDKVLEK